MAAYNKLKKKKKDLLEWLFGVADKGVKRKDLLKSFNEEQLDKISYICNKGRLIPLININGKDNNEVWKISPWGVEEIDKLKRDEFSEIQNKILDKQQKANRQIATATILVALITFYNLITSTSPQPPNTFSIILNWSLILIILFVAGYLIFDVINTILKDKNN